MSTNYMFLWKNKKIIVWISPLIWRYDYNNSLTLGLNNICRDCKWQMSTKIYLKQVHITIIIPPAYPVYRGYIDFVFSITMFDFVSVCLSVCIFCFSVKDFSGTTDIGF